jgi:hypothetical protein
MTGDTTGNLAFQTGAGANTITVPNGTGTIAVQGVSTNIVSGTAVASTSGTSIDFTSIPSWVKRITVMFNGVSTNGASYPMVQLGTSGGVTTTGYLAGGVESGSIRSAFTTGFGTVSGAGSNLIYGSYVITLITGNTWVSSNNMMFNQAGIYYQVTGAGSIALGGTLDRVRITTVNGTDTFDAGSINILYE